MCNYYFIHLLHEAFSMPRKSLHQQATSTIKDRIAKAMQELTPSHRQIADYVLAHSFRAATMTIDELA